MIPWWPAICVQRRKKVRRIKLNPKGQKHISDNSLTLLKASLLSSQRKATGKFLKKAFSYTIKICLFIVNFLFDKKDVVFLHFLHFIMLFC